MATETPGDLDGESSLERAIAPTSLQAAASASKPITKRAHLFIADLSILLLTLRRAPTILGVARFDLRPKGDHERDLPMRTDTTRIRTARDRSVEVVRFTIRPY